MKNSSERKKVLIIQSTIPHYRVPIFNKLNEFVDLTVLCDSGKVPDNVQFDTCKAEVCRVHYRVHKINLLSYKKRFDAIIMMLDSSYLATRLLSYFKGKTPLIFWGIGVSAGYNVRFGEDKRTVEVFSKYIKKADAALFYSDYPIKEYAQLGIPEEKMFVANNTVKVFETEEKEKTTILFVGTLYKQKKIFELLDAYFNAYSRNPLVPDLVIVGDGEEAESVKVWIKENGLEQKIIMTGGIYDEKELSRYFSEAIVCISPDQAGLSVLKSFGYGVPFITHKDAITGGERLNIINGENGVLFENFSEIEKLILDCADNKQEYINMGAKAKQYYKENRTVENMVKGFVDAIDYVTK